MLKDLTMEDKMDHKREDDEKAMRQTRMENTKYHKIHEIKNDEDMADIIDIGSTPRYTRSMKRKGKTSEQQPDAKKGKQKIDDDAGGIAKKAKVDEQVESKKKYRKEIIRSIGKYRRKVLYPTNENFSTDSI